jgi:hypothetical protein
MDSEFSLNRLAGVSRGLATNKLGGLEALAVCPHWVRIAGPAHPLSVLPGPPPSRTSLAPFPSPPLGYLTSNMQRIPIPTDSRRPDGTYDTTPGNTSPGEGSGGEATEEELKAKEVVSNVGGAPWGSQWPP